MYAKRELDHRDRVAEWLGAQPLLRGSDAVAGRHPDDESDHRYRHPFGISVHDHIIVGKRRARELEGDEVDLD